MEGEPVSRIPASSPRLPAPGTSGGAKLVAYRPADPILLASARGRCSYCKKAGIPARAGELGRGPDGGYWTVDHVIPRAAGGDDSDGNRVLACGTCNRRKGSRPLKGGRGPSRMWSTSARSWVRVDRPVAASAGRGGRGVARRLARALALPLGLAVLALVCWGPYVLVPMPADLATPSLAWARLGALGPAARPLAAGLLGLLELYALLGGRHRGRRGR